MQQSNTVFLCDKELADVVITSDSRGNNNIMSSLKYNRLVNLQSASHLFNKNKLFVRDKQLTDTLIVSDCAGINTIQAMSEISASANGGERNVFMEALHRVQREQNQATIDKYLDEKRDSLQDTLKMATQLYISGNYIKALECYHRALTVIETDSYPDEFRLDKSDIFRIKYALVLSNMGTNLYGPLKTACEMCATLILTYGAEYPSLYFTLGRAKVVLNLYESARIVLETGLSVLDECVVLSHLTFPASDQVIPDTDPTTLFNNFEETLEVCKNVPKPDVKCCHRQCIADSRAIYFNNPSFAGYVNVCCSERCQFNYHRSCWKIKLKSDRVKKPSAILNARCQTDSCSGVIAEIKILDQRLKVNAAIRAKTALDSSSTDNYKYTIDPNVVESRVYKTHFQLPTATFSSNLNTNATVFTPGQHQNITLHLKNASKTSAAVFDGLDVTDTSEDATGSDQTVQQSQLKADVPEFLPARVQPSVNSFTKWSTNAESTLEVAPDNGSNFVQPIIAADYEGTSANASECRTEVAFASVPSDLGDICQQPVEENDADRAILTEDKLVWTEPVVTESVPTQCQIDTSSQQTQTPTHICENPDTALLICQVHKLTYALFQAEDVNNRLVLRNKLLTSGDSKPTVTAATQTDNIVDRRQKNCLKWIHNTCTPAICHADILHSSNQKLEAEVKDLKKLSRLEKDCFAECKRKYHTDIEDLRSTVADLESQLTAVRSEFRDYKTNNTVLSVNKILLEQIQCNKNFYLPYLKTFEDKCKRMIWELQDLHVLATVDGVPSKDEIEESLDEWTAALADVESRQRIVMQHYETLLYNITSHQYTAVSHYPGQSLLLEPPNILVRYFKPLLIVNRRLDQDLANQMTSFYKILRQTYANVYSPQLSDTELKSNLELATKWAPGDANARLPAQKCTPGDANAKLPAQNGPGTLARMKVSDSPQVAAVPSTSTAQKGTKPRLSRATPEPDAAQCSSHVQQPKRPLPDIVGLDALTDKLQSQFPLIDGTVITEALLKIRGQHGGLTGMYSKEILAEVKKYVRAKQQTSPVPAAPVANPWNTINTPVRWHSDQQDTSCTICFERMTQNNSVTLRCQHLFHSTCIKIWLQTNSICPICRAFTTLDDEFPPLKFK